MVSLRWTDLFSPAVNNTASIMVSQTIWDMSIEKQHLFDKD